MTYSDFFYKGREIWLEARSWMKDGCEMQFSSDYFKSCRYVIFKINESFGNRDEFIFSLQKFQASNYGLPSFTIFAKII
ncbi:hypothetical protein ASE55_12680 [Chryseobacterium sp. Leaf201]|nr:hypothetical protein ASE55_12680 [Chryseobacterium sp. Leaf201]